MNKRLLAAGVALVAVVGLFGAGKWSDHRLAVCEQRGGQLASLALLTRGPDGFQPADSPAAGCDTDRVVAYASRRFIATDNGPANDATSDHPTAAQVDKPTVIAFYRAALQADGWRIDTRKPTPGPNAADLCAGKDDTYANLSFPVAATFEITVADHADAGARCT